MGEGEGEVRKGENNIRVRETALNEKKLMHAK